MSHSLRICLFVAVAVGLPRAASGQDAPDDVDAPTIEHTELQASPRDKPLEIRARIVDASGVFDPTVLYRVGSEGEFLRLSMTPAEDDDSGETYVATVPSEMVIGDIQYVIEAYDEMGNGPARHGEVEFPVTVRIVEPGPMTGGEPGEGTTAEPAPGQGDGTLAAGGDDVPPEDDGAPVGLYVGVGAGVGAVALVVAVLAAASVGTAVYWFTLGPGAPVNEDPDRVTIRVGAGTPTNGLLGASGPTGAGR